MLRFVGSIGAALLAAACSSIPDVEYSYYLPTSSTKITVTQTADCDSAGKRVVVLSTPAASTAYAADVGAPPVTVRIKDIEGAIGPFADSDASFSFTEDGRLKSINQNTAGQGENVVKSAVSLVGALAPLGGGPAKSAATPLSECDTIKAFGGGKPVTLTYVSDSIDLAKPKPLLREGSFEIKLTPTPDSEFLYGKLSKQLPVLVAYAKQFRSTHRAQGFSGASVPGDVSIVLRDTAVYSIKVKSDGQTIYAANATVPLNSTYALPIPRAALFGKQNFSLQLTDAGAIQQIDYGKGSGASAGLNAVTAVVNQVEPSAAQRVQDLKNQNDLIAQQARSVRCKTNPTSCT